MRPVFVYGTLRPGSWNHDAWLAPWLDGEAEEAVLDDHRLHAHDGLPYVVAEAGATVRGHLARLAAATYAEGLARLDRLEDVETRHYDRVAVVVGGVAAWLYVAGPAVAARLGPATVVPGGDWLARPAPR